MHLNFFFLTNIKVKKQNKQKINSGSYSRVALEERSKKRKKNAPKIQVKYLKTTPKELISQSSSRV